jgi:hypothetical protein
MDEERTGMSVIPLSAQAKTFSQRLFNETFYLSSNPDVLQAVSLGLTTAFEHFSTFGHRENRPLLPFFDTQAYLLANLDVLNATTDPGWVSAWNHFVLFGILEGRSPNGTTGFTGLFDNAKYLAQNADVATAVSNGDFRNGFEHYLLFGAKEGRAAFDKASNPIDLSGAVTPGKTFTLTTGPDTVVGGAGNDVIIGYINVGTPSLSTFTGADQINGGGGTDSLFITVENGAGFLPAATITSVENFFIRDVGAGGTYDFATVVGEKQVWSDRSTAAVTFNNLGTGATVGLKGDGATVLGDVTFTYATATDATTIAIHGGVGATGTPPNITRNQTGLSTVTITSTGAANKVGTIDLDTGTSIKSVTIDATTNLKATLAADYAANATLAIKGAATLVDLSGAQLSSNFKSVDASGMTAGGASVKLGAATTAFIGGAGNDTVDIGNLVFNGTVKVDGGGGTGDVLRLKDQGALTAATATNLLNFEILRIYGDGVNDVDTFDVSLLSGLTGVQVDEITAADGAVTVNGLSAALAQAVTIRGDQSANITFGVTGATTVGQIDTLKLSIDDGKPAVNLVTVGNLTAAGVENIVLSLTDNFKASSLTGLTEMTNITASGAGTLNLTFGALPLNPNTVVDASDVTGAVTINASGTIGIHGIKIISGSGNDTITGTNNDDVIITGAGKDTITGGAGKDTITTGAGRDTIITATLAVDRDIITDFTVGTGGDALSFAVNSLTSGSTPNNLAGDAPVTHIKNVAASGNLSAAPGEYIFLISVENVLGALSLNGTTVLDALVAGPSSGTITTAAAGDKLVFLVSNGTDVGVYLGNDADTNSTIDASEIELIAVLQGVSSVTSLVGGANGNFVYT